MVESVSSPSRTQFPIWAHVTPIEGERSKSAQDGVEVALQKYLTQKTQNECEKECWQSIRSKLVTSVLVRLGDSDAWLRLDDHAAVQNLIKADSRCSRKATILQRTPNGVLLDLREAASLAAFNYSEYDEKTWEIYCRLVVKRVRLATITPGIGGNERPGCICDLHWWSRPLWAWTWHERLFAHATFIMLDFLAQSSIKGRVVLSNWNDVDKDTISAWHESLDETYPIHLLYSPPTQNSNGMIPEDHERHTNEDPKEGNITPREVYGNLNQPLLSEARINCEEIEETTPESEPAPADINEDESPIKIIEEVDGPDDIVPILEMCTPSFQDESQQASLVSCVSQELDGQSSPSGFPTTASSEKSTEPKCALEPKIQNPPEVTPSPQIPPQIDSQGIDLSLLSQLPADMRSEVRLAAAIQGRTKQQAQLKTNASMQSWLSVTKTSSKQSSGHKRSAKKSFDRPAQAKRSLGIREFLVRKHAPTS